ncbi:MAG: NusG domain II-containing protein [Oscillospiraceae bacterium]
MRFINSVCPDHVCEGFGWLSQEEDHAVCAPARVVVSIEE